MAFFQVDSLSGFWPFGETRGGGGWGVGGIETVTTEIQCSSPEDRKYQCNCSLFFSFSFRWLVIAVGLLRAYFAKGSYHNLYYSIEKPLKFFQTGALLEVGRVIENMPSIPYCHWSFPYISIDN